MAHAPWARDRIIILGRRFFYESLINFCTQFSTETKTGVATGTTASAAMRLIIETKILSAVIMCPFTGCRELVSLTAGSGGSQGFPASAWRMASSAVRPWAAAESR